MPFNILAIRNINKVKILVDKESMPSFDSPTEKTSSQYGANTYKTNRGVCTAFEAYRPQNPLSLTSTVRMDDPKESTWGSILSFGANLMGIAPSFDVPRKFFYRGSDPIQFQVPCFLKLETSVYQDLKLPLIHLAQLMLPTRGPELPDFLKESVTDAADTLSGWFERLSGFFGKAAESVNSGIDAAGDFIQKYVGKVYIMEMPPAYKMMNGDTGGYTLKVGKMSFRGVIIRNFTITLPPFLYEEGIPDHISLNITFETLRPATASMFTSFIQDL